jgi:hypothetical protein
VIGPVLLLLLIQVQFLPYHLEWVTWVQRIAIVVDVIFLWLLWPDKEKSPEVRWTSRRVSYGCGNRNLRRGSRH